MQICLRLFYYLYYHHYHYHYHPHHHHHHHHHKFCTVYKSTHLSNRYPIVITQQLYTIFFNFNLLNYFKKEKDNFQKCFLFQEFNYYDQINVQNLLQNILHKIIQIFNEKKSIKHINILFQIIQKSECNTFKRNKISFFKNSGPSILLQFCDNWCAM